MDEMCGQKETLRRRYRELRQSLTPRQLAEASAELCRRLAGWEVLRSAQRVLIYLAFRNEPDLSPLFDLPPSTSILWAAPRVQGRQLVAHEFDPQRLVRHHFGMLEPQEDSPEIDPATLDLVLVPGVAFDRQGGRLGFGGGFYDRFLAMTSAVRVGIAHDCCLADRLPCSESDERMDWVATPSQLIECLRKRRDT